MQNLAYLIRSAGKWMLGRGYDCPSCQSPLGETVDRKYWVTSLRRCQACGLLYRAPATSKAENARLYQRVYEEGTTTDLPDDGALRQMREENFRSLSTSYLPYLEVMDALGARPGQHVMDFGCSWGYGSHQLQQAGFSVEAFEISRHRSAYARERLGIRTVHLEEIPGGRFDVFFSAHVVEHVPSVEEMMRLGESALRPGGLFLGVTPNGSAAWRKRDPEGWHRSWGYVHPQLLDEEYLKRMSGRRPCVAASAPYPLESLRAWDGGPLFLPMGGSELMVAFRTPAATGSE